MPACAAVMRAIGVLGVEGEGDPQAVAHFSTPVITMPRMKNALGHEEDDHRDHDASSALPAWMRPRLGSGCC